MGYAPDGSVATPPPSASSDGSRLPQLLSQLQGAGAGIELLDGSQSQVLAAQDAQGKDSPSETSIAGDRTPGATSTSVPGTPTRSGTPTRTPTQQAEGGSNPTTTPTPGSTASATPGTTSTPTPTPTPTPSPTPLGPPSEGGSTSTATPQHE